MQSDAILLAEWTARRSDAAFARLVERYIALVHSAARRQVSDPHLAEEITQAVFILLARKAGSLTRRTVLAGWLCRTAHFAARDALRAERRRQHREQLAATMDTSPDAAWQQLAPLLEEAVAQLRESDRNAIVLRYYEQRSLDETGAALGIGADAAQKRVARALEKLRGIFAKRGVTLTGAAIAGAVSANAVQAVPVGLAAKISAAGVLAVTTHTTSTAIVMTTLQKTIIGVTLAVVFGWGVFEVRQASSARSEVQALKQQQAPLVEQVQRLTRERDEAMNLLAGSREDVDRLNRNTAELLKLRGEVTRLRHQVKPLQGGNELTSPATAGEDSQIDVAVAFQGYERDQDDGAWRAWFTATNAGQSFIQMRAQAEPSVAADDWSRAVISISAQATATFGLPVQQTNVAWCLTARCWRLRERPQSVWPGDHAGEGDFTIQSSVARSGAAKPERPCTF